MAKRNRIAKLCLIAALILFLTSFSCLHAAANMPDLTRKGSVTFSMQYEGKPIPGGSLSMYRIAEWGEQDGGYGYIWVPELSDAGDAAGLRLREYGTELFASRIFMLINSRSLPALTRQISRDGVVRFDDLDCGLYVVFQTDPAPGYKTINAFCISIPMIEDDSVIYDISAAPKPRPTQPDTTYTVTTYTATLTSPGLTSPSVPTTVPSNPTEPYGTTAPSGRTTTVPSTTSVTVPSQSQQTTNQTKETETERLPQTGQLWWPAWVFGSLGFVLFGTGIALCVLSRKPSEDNEP